jgi:hypothetical protein
MKKFLSVALGIVLTLAAIALTSSCQKDIDKARSLIVSSWVSEKLDVEVGGTVYKDVTYRLYFSSEAEFTVSIDGMDAEVSGIYLIIGSKPRLTGNTILFSPNDKWLDGTDEPLVGTFSTESELIVIIDEEEVKFERTVLVE